jgi:hypothetical protein
MSSSTAKTVALTGGAAALLGGILAVFSKKSAPRLQGASPIVRKGCNCGR